MGAAEETAVTLPNFPLQQTGGSRCSPPAPERSVMRTDPNRGKTIRHCFVCGEPATTLDHVPPRCFFPKRKDLPSGMAEARRNLVTVPACDAHNGRASKDDEVASYVILLSHQANQLGSEQFLRKGLRAITGRKGLIDSIFKHIEVFQTPDGREVPTLQFDAERVNRVMDRVARGLFFHDFGRRWKCRLSILADGPLMEDLSPSPYRSVIRTLEPLFNHAPRKGSNPEVFWYDWIIGVRGDCSHILRMCFYGGIRYFALARGSAS
jgi:hypothetical protein